MPHNQKAISISISGRGIIVIGKVFGDYLVHSSIPINGKCGWMVRRMSDNKVITGEHVIAERSAACRLAERLARTAKTRTQQKEGK